MIPPSGIGPASLPRPKERTITVLQGELHITSDPDEVLSTVLGSCIAVCMWDPQARVGGMNHFLLPSDESGDVVSIRYGAHAMELLINGLLKRGASRPRLRAKLFGGGQMTSQFKDIGTKNISFAKQFLQTEGIPCLAESLGGTMARRVRFSASSGQASMMLIPKSDFQPQPKPRSAIPTPPKIDITLF